MLRPLIENVQVFDGFGPCLLACDAEVPAVDLDLPRDRRSARRLIRRHCLPVPGVYGMIDAEGELIYVGKSKGLRNRLLSYFSKTSEPSKARRIVERTRRLVWEAAPGEFAALIRELELIRRFRPRFNVRGQPRRLRRAYVAVGRGPAAYVYLTFRPSARDDALFGPVRGKRRYRRAVRLLNDWFQLRDCSGRVPIRFSDQLELFGKGRAARCLRHEFGTCLAPCAAGCTRREYANRVRRAESFLRGRDVSLLGRLEAEMRSAAADAQFERAAAVRDTWEELRGLHQQLQRLEEARQRYSFIYPISGYRDRETWCLIHRGHVVAAAPSPRFGRSARRCLDLIERTYSTNGTSRSPHPPEDLDGIHLVSAWFRQYPEEFGRTLSPKEAVRICRAKACR